MCTCFHCLQRGHELTTTLCGRCKQPMHSPKETPHYLFCFSCVREGQRSVPNHSLNVGREDV